MNCEYQRWHGDEVSECKREGKFTFQIAPNGTASRRRENITYCTYHYRREREGGTVWIAQAFMLEDDGEVSE